MQAVMKTDLKTLKKIKSGKVRDIYAVDGDKLLIVATDRISAFDVVFNEGIPDKGKILTEISNIWFKVFSDIPNHIISTTPENTIPEIKEKALEGRAVLVKKADRIDFECVVRGYLYGSAWKEYSKTGEVSGIKLPEGLKKASKLDEPIFTPATKAEEGHDENVSFAFMMDKIGTDTAEKVKDLSIQIYQKARSLLEKEGIILVDTKFEFGIYDGNIILIDELLTPDSSRFWRKADWEVGKDVPNMDKQFLRDYLEKLNWDKTPPPPPLPEDVINGTRQRYLQMLEVVRKIGNSA